MTFQAEPAMRNRDREMIPVGLTRAMMALALSAVAIAGYASISGRVPSGQPAASAMVSERMLILQGGGAQAVTVLDASGDLLVDLPHGGFVTVVQNALETERKRSGIDPLLPVRLVTYANHRIALEDPVTGWSVELYAFGDDNKAAWERLLIK